MSSLQELAGRQLGPLPLGAWALACAGGVAVAVVVRRGALRAGSSSSAGNGDELAADGSSSPAGDSSGAITTNEEWLRAGVRLLISGGYDPTAAEAALSRYLSGVATTQSERAMVSAVLRALGTPPSPPPAPDAGTPTDSAPPRVVTPPAYPFPGGLLPVHRDPAPGGNTGGVRRPAPRPLVPMPGIRTAPTRSTIGGSLAGSTSTVRKV